jgi:hypothetical protein
MKKKIFALLVACAFGLNAASVAFAQVKTMESERQTQSLAGSLPASDLVVSVNTQRLFNEGLPQVLSNNQPMLKKIFDEMDKIKGQTGVDLRQFEQFALGVASRNVSAKEFNFEPVMLVRGSYNPAAMISLAKIALGSKYREEKIGDKTVYIFTPPPAKVKPQGKTPQSNKPPAKTSVFEKAMEKMFADLSREFAVGAFDSNTLVIGSTARLRETFQTKTRIDAEMLGLVNRKPNALMSFGARLPNGMSGIVNLENDELGRNIDSIRQISGAVDVADGSAMVSLLAKTLKPEQAQSLKDTLVGLQMFGKAIFGGAKEGSKKVFGQMVENVSVSSNGSEVMLDLQVPQSDIDILIGLK